MHIKNARYRRELNRGDATCSDRSPLWNCGSPAALSGSVLLELIWVIPAFAAGLGLIIAVGVYLNARSALQDAVSNGLVLAATRAQSGAPLSTTLGSGRTRENVTRLLVSSELQLSERVLENYARASYSLSGVGSDGIIRTRSKSLLGTPVRTVELLAMAYIGHALEVHTLGDARFPCAAEDTSPGCLICLFFPGTGANSFGPEPSSSALRPGFADPVLSELLSEPLPGGGFEIEALQQRLSVTCWYYPQHALLEFLVALARGIGLEGLSLGGISASAAVDLR